ncbi:MAG: YSIRK-type signal peptide-containing protein, partial [Lactobacillus sp.]|nr:YSIRK-type signal peptide-containing protein [Lactobacillus sp.]
TANQRQRFSIRKLTVGAASVLLGTTFLFGAGQTVQADSVNGVTNGEPASAEVKSTDEEQTQSNEVSSEVKDDQQKDASATDQSAKTVVQNENKENSSEVDKTKYTQEAQRKLKQMLIKRQRMFKRTIQLKNQRINKIRLKLLL